MFKKERINYVFNAYLVAVSAPRQGFATGLT